MPAAATHTHTHMKHCAFLFLKNVPIAPKPKRDDHAIQAMSPYETNMHPNRKQKNPKFIEIILLSSFLNWTKTFVTQTKWGEKKQKEEKVFLYGPKPLQLSFSWIFLRLAIFIYYIFFRTKQNRKKNCLVEHPLIISRLLVLLNEIL